MMPSRNISSFVKTRCDRTADLWSTFVFGTDEGLGVLLCRVRWRHLLCLFLISLLERLTFFAVLCNLLVFCTLTHGYLYRGGATITLCFTGLGVAMPVLLGHLTGGLMKRSCMIYVSCALHLAGTIMLPVAAFPFEDFFSDGKRVIHLLGPRDQQIVVYVSLLLVLLGSSGVRANFSPICAFQLKELHTENALTFFEWFHGLLALGSACAFLCIANMQRSVAHFLGFLIPCFSLLLTFAACFLAHSRQLRQPSKGASVWECCSVVLSASRRACTERWDGSAWPGNWASWMDRARASCGGFNSDGQVDGTLHVLRLTPLFCIQILLWICFYQVWMHCKPQIRAWLI
uniref:Uncharacterized protein n=1 Tax=Eptatretus burgeri TaxID=7764 RepID=A0A8C4QSU7_EPTBU